MACACVCAWKAWRAGDARGASQAAAAAAGDHVEPGAGPHLPRTGHDARWIREQGESARGVHQTQPAVRRGHHRLRTCLK